MPLKAEKLTKSRAHVLEALSSDRLKEPVQNQKDYTNIGQSRIQRIVPIPLDRIAAVSELQNRVDAFNPEANLDDRMLLESIEERGVTQPVKLLLIQKDPLSYQIIFGHRRIAACRTLKRPTVPAVVVTAAQEDTKERDIQTIQENSLRLDLTDYEKALTAQAFMEEHQASKTETAKVFGCSNTLLTYWLKLVDEQQTAPQVLQLVKDGYIGASTAAKIMALPEDQRAGVVSGIKRGLTFADTLSIVKQNAGLLPKKEPSRGTGSSQGKTKQAPPSDDHPSKATKMLVDKILGDRQAAEKRWILERSQEDPKMAPGVLAALMGVSGDADRVMQIYQTTAMGLVRQMEKSLTHLQRLADMLDLMDEGSPRATLQESLKSAIEKVVGGH